MRNETEKKEQRSPAKVMYIRTSSYIVQNSSIDELVRLYNIIRNSKKIYLTENKE